MGQFLIVTGDFVRTGGMDSANFALAKHLAARGDTVHLVAHHVAVELSSHQNVAIHLVPRPYRSHLAGAPLLDAFGRYQAARLRGVRARVIVNGGNCDGRDLNWVHYVHAAFSASAAPGIFQRSKQRLSRPFFLHRERRALCRSRVIICNSQRTRQDVLTHFDIAPDRVHTVYYGIDPGVFRPATQPERLAARAALSWPEDRPVVAFIGALGDRRKGFDVLFEAWQRLCGMDWDADLAVVGQGTELPRWRARAAAAGISSRIHFLGFRSDVPRILHAADALVSPTRYEAYGLGVHEALCCGLPSLVSAAAGVAERYTEQLRPLLLTDPDDVEELVTRLRDWRERSAEYDKRAKDFSVSLRARSWGDMANDIAVLAA